MGSDPIASEKVANDRKIFFLLDCHSSYTWLSCVARSTEMALAVRAEIVGKKSGGAIATFSNSIYYRIFHFAFSTGPRTGKTCPRGRGRARSRG